MVARWRRRRRRSKRMSARAFDSVGNGAGSVARLRSEALRLGVRSRGFRQDACAVAARRASAAGARAAVAHSVPHLHQGGRGQYGGAHFRHSRQMDAARRRRARQRGRKGLRTAARPRGARFRAQTFRAHRGDAGRPEDPDDPRLLRKDSASLSVRGQCSRRLSHPRRYRARRVAGRRAQGDAGSRS